MWLISMCTLGLFYNMVENGHLKKQYSTKIVYASFKL
jgi:hypothetical protein